MRLMLAVLLLMLSAAAHAADTPDTDLEPNLTAVKNNPLSNFYGYLFAGEFLAANNSGQIKTVDYKGGSRIPWGLGIGYKLSRHLAVDGSIEWWGDRYERIGEEVFVGTANNKIQIDSFGLSFTARYQYTHRSFNGYFGFGSGFYDSQLWVTNTSDGRFTKDRSPHDETVVGYHLVVGGGYRVSSASFLGIELRHRSAKADFRQYTNGEVDIGGTTVGLIWYTN